MKLGPRSEYAPPPDGGTPSGVRGVGHVRGGAELRGDGACGCNSRVRQYPAS